MADIRGQLELLGLGAALRFAEAGAVSSAERTRRRRQIEVTHDILADLPGPDELGFLHSGLCQVYLPRSRPPSNLSVWARTCGRVSLHVQPGTLYGPPNGGREGGRWVSAEEAERAHVGVPYGARARLVMLYLQTEGMRGRIVSMGPSMTAWMRSLGLAVTGGVKGTIGPVREQILRVALCRFTLQWAGEAGHHLGVRDLRIADASTLEVDAEGRWRWPEALHLSANFHDHLREHAVPLDQRALAQLAGSALALDLYCFLAHRLPRLRADLTLTWRTVAGQFGNGDTPPEKIAQLLRNALSEVGRVYPAARVEATRQGLVLRPSPPSVPPRTVVAGGLQSLPKTGVA